MLKTKNSVTTTVVPTTLQQGELAVNITDKKLWVGNAATTPVLLVNGGPDGVFTSITDSGNLTFTGTGNRIRGDFSNATFANRVYVQTSTSGGNTVFGLLPDSANATPITTFEACLSSDPANTNTTQVQVTTTDSRINAGTRGTASALPLTIYTGGSERLRIDTSGNVGIGTSSPAQKLHVAGTGDTRLQVESTSSGAAVFYLNGSNAAFAAYNTIQSRNGSTVQWAIGGSGTENALPFYTNGTTERMRIDSSGNVLIGTTSNKGVGLTVQSSSNTIWTTSTTSDQSGLVVQNSAVNTGSSAGLVAFQVGTSGIGTGVGGISYNGTLTVYATTSDYRLKENVKPMVGALSIVSQLNPVTYDWTESKVNGQGFIAHELQAVIPDAVVGIKDAVDSEGNAVYQQIDTSVLVATLTAAIQEQQALINNLTTRLNALEGK